MTNDFLSKEEFNDGKYRVLSLTDGQKNLRRVVCDTPGICIIPFDTSDGKIKNVYLARYMDYLKSDQGHTCISLESKENYDSNFEEVEEICQSELGINCDVKEVFYLGNINHTIPFSKKFKCYGINLDNHSKDLNGFTLDVSNPNGKLYTLDKIRFNRVLNGQIEDSVCLSASMLLISYINN